MHLERGGSFDREIGQPQLLPLACTLGAEDGQSRLVRWQRLRDVAAPVVNVDGGQLEIRYQAGPGVHEELTALAAAERTCCSFVTWAVSVTGDRPVLHITAPPEQPEALAPIAALFGATAQPSQ